MFDYKYLSDAHMQGLKKYKYSAIDTSPLSNYVMHPTWNFVTKFIPRWIAPNLITFVGFLCMVLAVLLLTVYDYGFTAAVGSPGQNTQYGVPIWLYTTCGVLVFLSYNLDGIDGKQARRIGVSGPLGELFDHGLDSYVVFLIPFSIISVFGIDPEYSVSTFRTVTAVSLMANVVQFTKTGYNYREAETNAFSVVAPVMLAYIYHNRRGLLMTISVVLNFYVSHCEKYTTGTLYLPWGYDLSMWVSSLVFIVAGRYGPDAYKFYVFGDVTFGVFFETVAHLVGLFGTAPLAIYNVYVHRKKSRAKSSLLSAIRPIWSLFFVLAVVITWALQSRNQIVDYDPRAFIFLSGTLFSNVASRLIIAEMTHQKCDLINPLFYPLMTAVAASVYHPQIEIPVFYSLLAFVFLSHIHYGICVVRQICWHYKIDCFTVPKEKR